MTIMMWFFAIIWVIFLFIFIVGSAMLMGKNGLFKGIFDFVYGVIGIGIVSVIYWGILIFLDIQFNFLHWF